MYVSNFATYDNPTINDEDRKKIKEEKMLKIYSYLSLLKSSRKNQHFIKSRFRHLRVEIFLTFFQGFGVVEAQFLINIFLKKNPVYSRSSCKT